MTTYRAAVIGLSGIGQGRPAPAPHPSLGHALAYSHVSAYEDEPQTELVAVCDLSQTAIERFGDQWGDRCSHTQIFTDYREMLQKTRPDIVSVAISDHLHADVFIDCARAGVKGIYCEKPIATTMADARRMVEAARETGVKVAVNHTRRWHPMFIQVRELVRNKTIGELRYVGAMHGGPRSMLFRNGTHIIDHLLYFTLDQEPRWVSARLGDKFLNYGTEYAGGGGKDPELDPDGSVLIGFDDGLRGAYTAVRNSAVGSEWDIQGTEGRIQVRNEVKLVEARLSVKNSSGRLLEQNLPYEYFTSGLMQAAVRDIIQAVESGGETLSPPEAAFNTLAVMLGAVQSNSQGGRFVEAPITDVGERSVSA